MDLNQALNTTASDLGILGAEAGLAIGARTLFSGTNGVLPHENVMAVIVHGAAAGMRRPAGAVVTWIGSVEPTNAINNDIWEVTS